MSHILLDSQQAHALLIQNQPLENFIIPFLDISQLTFDHDVIITHCIIEQLDATHCTFKGRVDFSGTKFGNNIDNQSGGARSNEKSSGEDIKFRHTYFEQEALFESCEFHSPADFSHANFNRGVLFKGAHFYSDATFIAATVEDISSFEDAHFYHEANFSGANFGREVIFKGSKFFDESDFTQAHFESAEFEEAEFAKEANFELAQFSSWADFSQANFAGGLNFVQSSFENGADFASAQIHQADRFEKATFVEDCYFNEAQFQGLADFDTAIFNKGVDFRKCKFFDRAEFRNASINDGSFAAIVSDKPLILSNLTAKKIDFQGAQLRNVFIFSCARVEQSANFSGARFDKLTCFDDSSLVKGLFNGVCCNAHASFKGTIFCIDSYFQNALFNTADFSRAVFQGQAHFDETKFSHTVLFRHTQFEQGEACFKSVTFSERVDFAGATFKDRLCLQDLVVESMIITWEQVEGKLATHQLKKYEEATKVYGLLKNIFERQNRYEDMDKAYRLFKRMERKAGAQKGGNLWHYIKRFFNFLILDLGSGYGTRPMNIAITTLIIILLFGGIYYVASDQITIGGNPLSLSNPLERLVFCVYYSAVSFVTLGAENLSPNYYSWLKYIVTCQAFLGFFLMTLFVATFTRKVIR